MTRLTARQASHALRRYAKPRKAKLLGGFFKTGPGQYGEGDRFLGVMVPQTRAVAKLYRALPFPEVSKLLHSPWHEDRLLALLVLVDRTGRAESDRFRAECYRFYVRHMKFINNWDLVDLTAPQVVGAYLAGKPKGILFRWARSKLLWDRRVAVLATFWFIRERRFKEALRLARMLLRDREDLMHKAVGWMLREMGKRDEKVLRGFLDQNASRMPRTMLRYSLEKFNPAVRKHYMGQGA